MKAKKNYMIILSVIIMLIVLVISVSKLGSEIKQESSETKSLEETVLEDIKEAKVETLDDGTVNVNGNMIAYTVNGSSTNTAWSTLIDGGYIINSISCSTGSARISASDGQAIVFTSVPAVCTVDLINGCKVYCRSSSNCSTTRPSSGLYGVFTCDRSTKKTGPIESCWYESTQCNGGAVGSAATNMCTNTGSNNLFYYCNSSLPNNSVTRLGLSSIYSCSC